MTETTCRACGAALRFIKMTTGKTMPVDAAAVRYIPDPTGKDVLVMENGSTARGRITGDEGGAIGYISHFATCTNPDYFRKPRKGDRRRAAT